MDLLEDEIDNLNIGRCSSSTSSTSSSTADSKRADKPRCRVAPTPFHPTAIMQSMGPHSLVQEKGLNSLHSLPDATIVDTEMTSVDLGAVNPGIKSFILIDDNEKLQFASGDSFRKTCCCESDSLVKVLSIIGNTGEGKSYTLNHTLFGGKEVFRTSGTQEIGTAGVWAAYDPNLNVICLDTEGLLGVSTNQNKTTRLLLKVLAVSDVIVYRTRAERLRTDLFTFLADASKAYRHHFTPELKSLSERGNLQNGLGSLGPSVVIFHETAYTEVLKTVNTHTPEDQIRHRFQKLDLSVDAFSSIQYIGVRSSGSATDFSLLKDALQKQLSDSKVRSRRSPSVIFKALKVLNEKFSGEIEKTSLRSFPDEYFTCPSRCLSCDSRCTKTLNHGIDHESNHKCRYEHQFENQVFTCRRCHQMGVENTVVPKTSSSQDSTWVGLAKYAWSGYVLECPHCGVIYRSRQYWYGNTDPVNSIVRTEIQHVWPGGVRVIQGTHNAAQRILDSVNYISNTVASVSSKPTRAISSWVADQIAPSYWTPNDQIKFCYGCRQPFELTDRKHHCRACGEGFCNECSDYQRPVPERGWGMEKQRVCGDCYETELLKDSARPTYWESDELCRERGCAICRTKFSSPRVTLHHCRDCGRGVCADCSPMERPVPSRGWDGPVRVCMDC